MNNRIRNSKTTFGAIALLGASALILIGTASAQDAGATTSAEPVSAPDNRRVTPLDANSSAVEWVERLTNSLTGEVTTQPHNYVTVGTGLNYLHDSGQLRQSEDLIELTNDGGAAALRAPHKIRFNANLNNGPAPITLTTVSNRVFRSQPRGLYYVNLQTGEYALVAPVQDSIGELHPPNQLIYPDCLAGGLVKGDYRVTCTKAAAEADLILLTQLPPPELFFGTVNPQAVRLEWVTEFLDAPTPKMRTRILKRQTDATLRQTMTEPDLVDQTMDFGDLWFPLGRAFAWDGSTNSDAPMPAQIQLARQGSDTNQVLVAKHWVQTPDGRTVLIESVDWQDIAPKLDSLPAPGRVASASNLRERVTKARQLPVTKVAGKKSNKPMRVAAAPYRAKGYVLDYVTVPSSGTDYTFSSGVTYYVTSTYFSGTLTFGYGSVIKLSSYSSLMTYGSVSGGGAILTSADDDLYGEKIVGSTGVPTYAGNPALYIYYRNSGVSLNSMKIRWAYTGVELDPDYDDTTDSFQYSSIEQCQTGIYAPSRPDGAVVLVSSTYCGVQTPLYDGNYGYSFSGSLTDVCSGDADGDGLPDVWENKYFGNTYQNGSGDADGDGLTNLQEYQLGFNPMLNESAQTGKRANFTYDPAGRLKKMTGMRTETVGVDGEGNVKTDSN